MIEVVQQGNFNKTEQFLKSVATPNYTHILEEYAKRGVAALSMATPIDTGNTAHSWGYQIKFFKGGSKIIWTNSNTINGVSIAVILQYGHATQNGGYVQGRDYINPAIRPIFDKVIDEVWREVTRQ